MFKGVSDKYLEMMLEEYRTDQAFELLETCYPDSFYAESILVLEKELRARRSQGNGQINPFKTAINGKRGLG